MAIARVYFDQDLRYGIDGFTKELQAKRISQKAIASDDMTMFVNTRRTHVKIFWAGQFVLSFRKRKGEGKVTVQDLKSIPKCFSSGMFNASVQKHLGNHLEKGIHVVVDDEGLKIA
jgi:hypothetical protein